MKPECLNGGIGEKSSRLGRLGPPRAAIPPSFGEILAPTRPRTRTRLTIWRPVAATKGLLRSVLNEYDCKVQLEKGQIEDNSDLGNKVTRRAADYRGE